MQSSCLQRNFLLTAATACADRFAHDHAAALGLGLLAAEVAEQADQVKSAALVQRGGRDAYTNAPILKRPGAVLAPMGALAMVHCTGHGINPPHLYLWA